MRRDDTIEVDAGDCRHGARHDQCRRCSSGFVNAPCQPRIAVDPVDLTKIDDLSFGSVVPSPVSGTVVIDATTGLRKVLGGLTAVPSNVGRRAYFGGAGSPSQQVLVIVTGPTTLTSAAGDTLTVLALTLDGSPVRSIHPVNRTFFFGVGGIIQVAANQPEGVYTSDYDVTANYL